MPEFVKRPVTVSAERFDADRKPYPAGVYEVPVYQRVEGQNEPQVIGVSWRVSERELTADEILALERDPHLFIRIPQHEIQPGDWVITGVEGERYPCSPSIFAATYAAVDPPAPADLRERPLRGGPAAISVQHARTVLETVIGRSILLVQHEALGTIAKHLALAADALDRQEPTTITVAEWVDADAIAALTPHGSIQFSSTVIDNRLDALLRRALTAWLRGAPGVFTPAEMIELEAFAALSDGPITA